MPSLNIEDLNKLNIENLFNNYETFVETGTFMGETIVTMEPLFKNLHTVEIKKEFYQNIKMRYNGDKINFHLGDSSIILKDICNNLFSPTLFFLDGYWSAGNTGKGDKDCPLYEELNNIMKYCKYKCIIIIDDVRLFGKGPNKGNEICNWEDINETTILNIVNERLETHYFIDSPFSNKDRMILHLND